MPNPLSTFLSCGKVYCSERPIKARFSASKIHVSFLIPQSNVLQEENTMMPQRYSFYILPVSKKPGWTEWKR